MSARPSRESHSGTDLGYASKPVIEENKAQDSTEYTDASIIKDQSGQSSKVRPPSMKAVQPVMYQLPLPQRKWKQSHMLSNGRLWHHHRFSKLFLFYFFKRNGKPRLPCDNVRHPHSLGSGGSSVGGASDRKVRRNTDAGSSPRGGKGFVSQSQLSVQTLAVSVQPPFAVACCTSVRTSTILTPAAIPLALYGHRKTLHTPIGIGSAALAAAFSYG